MALQDTAPPDRLPRLVRGRSQLQLGETPHRRKTMPNPYRILSLGVLGEFGAALGAAFITRKPAAPPPPPKWLPEAYAAPVEHVRHETLRHGHTLSELLQQLR